MTGFTGDPASLARDNKYCILLYIHFYQLMLAENGPLLIDPCILRLNCSYLEAKQLLLAKEELGGAKPFMKLELYLYSITIITNYITLRHDGTLQTHACSYIWETQEKIKIGCSPRSTKIEGGWAVTAGLVQNCLKPRALFHKPLAKDSLCSCVGDT